MSRPAQLGLFDAPPMPRLRIKRVVAHGSVTPPAPPPRSCVEGLAILVDQEPVDAVAHGFRHLPPGANVRLVHVVTAAGEEIRGYYIFDDRLYVWLSQHPSDWAAIDERVQEKLGMELLEHQGEPGEAARAAGRRR